MKAVVYKSNTGTTAGYAKLLAEEFKLPCYSIEEAKDRLRSNDEIIYLGWVMASNIKGFKQANKRYIIKAVCGVGMTRAGVQDDAVRKASKIPDGIQLFTLQGGFDVKKLSGMYKFCMNIMVKTAGKALAKKEDRTPDEDQMLDMMLHGRDYVCKENLKEVLQWYEKQSHKL